MSLAPQYSGDCVIIGESAVYGTGTPAENPGAPTQTGAIPGAPVRRIPLGRSGLFALIDEADFERVSAYAWHAKRKWSQPSKVYAQRTLRPPGSGRNGKKVSITLHRWLVGAGPGVVVDHINGDSLDNRRSNLRLTDVRGNSTNVTSSKRQKLGGFKGVSWNKRAGKWQASICGGEVKANGKRRQLYLGVFTDPVDAARAYDAAALRCFGEFASLNFQAGKSAAARVMGGAL